MDLPKGFIYINLCSLCSGCIKPLENVMVISFPLVFIFESVCHIIEKENATSIIRKKMCLKSKIGGKK